MAVLNPTVLRTQELTWVKDESLFVVEDSSIPRPSLVWDDACDEGYTLVSERTGERLVVALEFVKKQDGDILWWDYQPITPEYHNRFILRVFND